MGTQIDGCQGVPSRGDSKSAEYGVCITTGGASVRGHASPLPIPDILYQTSRMRKLTATICLTIAVLLGVTGEVCSEC